MVAPDAPASPLLVGPWLEQARQQLVARCPALPSQASPDALAGLEAALTHQLLAVASEVLTVELAVWRACQMPGFAPGQPEPSSADFCHPSRGSGLFATYPVLARQLSRRVECWADALAAFHTDLVADAPTLESLFPGERSLGHIATIEPTRGDPHRGGRAVLLVTFVDGIRLVYKPRSCGPERALFELQAWCAARAPALEFMPARMLDRGDHGWMEFIAPRTCADDREVRDHGRSSGRLLGLAYALAGGDFHLENVVGHGPHAVAVDAELLLTPRIATPWEQNAGTRAYTLWNESVASTQLVHQWDSSLTGAALDFAGIRPTGNVDDIVAGFSEVYEFMLAQRQALLADDGPLAGWPKLLIRFVHRPTIVYAALLRAAQQPAALADEAGRRREFAPLYRALGQVAPAREAVTRKVIAAEIAALEAGDVPYFHTLADSRDLRLPDGTLLRDFFAYSGLERARARLRSLSRKDYARQCAIIRSSFHLARASDPSHRPLICIAPPSVCASPATEDDFRTAACGIFRSLRASALCVNGTATWIGPQLIPATERYRAQPLSLGLYDGLTGVALFLAAATRVLDDPATRKLSDEVNATLARSLRDPLEAAPVSRAGIGISDGLGGLLYGLTLCAALRDDPALAALASEAADLITPEAIVADKKLDVISGSAGAVLALLAHHAATGESASLDSARFAGEHLLWNRTPAATGHRVWRVKGQCLTGFSHGAAGGACALLRLHALTGEPAFKSAAEEAIAYEHTQFDPVRRNWPDLRGGDDGARFMRTWCHGGPGIALARLATLDLLDTPRIRADIAAGVDVARGEPVSPIDHCCCGNLGRAAILDYAGSRLGDNTLRDAARQLAGAVLARARSAGGYGCFHALPPTVQSPGFFQGLSGIGYTLLHLLAPAMVPNVLAFDPPLVPSEHHSYLTGASTQAATKDISR